MEEVSSESEKTKEYEFLEYFLALKHQENGLGHQTRGKGGPKVILSF